MLGHISKITSPDCFLLTNYFMKQYMETNCFLYNVLGSIALSKCKHHSFMYDSKINEKILKPYDDFCSFLNKID